VDERTEAKDRTFPLNYLAIPRTHDSGTYPLDPNSLLSDDFPLASIQTDPDNYLIGFGPTGIFEGIFNSAISSLLNPIIFNWPVAQDESFTNQLNAGIRYFDIRPCPYPNPGSETDIRICHSLFGTTVSDVLTQVKNFSLANPDEIIIVDFNHITSHQITGTLSDSLVATIINTLTNVNRGDMLIPLGTGGAGFPNIHLGTDLGAAGAYHRAL
jgi:hypothetical protein